MCRLRAPSGRCDPSKALKKTIRKLYIQKLQDIGAFSLLFIHENTQR